MSCGKYRVLGVKGIAGTVSLVFAVLVVLSSSVAASGRPSLMGHPVGYVTDIDKASGTVSVDIGSNNGVLKGLSFSVVDGKGHQAALVTAGEVYDDLFWSAPLGQRELGGVAAGMEVRWVFTPETIALLAARKKGTAGAYRDFVGRFPDSRFIPDLVHSLPDEMLEEIDPEYYSAWKSYNKDAFQKYAEAHPGTGLANAALAEVKSIDGYEAEQKKIKEERAKKAAAYEKERKRQEDVLEKMRAREDMRQREEMHGKLVNNSSEPVRFEFQPPSILPPTVVKPGEEFELNHPTGTYDYKVFAVQQDDSLMPSMSMDDTSSSEPQPLAEGTVDIQFDFWEVTYP